jgi:hypothetical protein
MKRRAEAREGVRCPRRGNYPRLGDTLKARDGSRQLTAQRIGIVLEVVDVVKERLPR